MKRKVKDEFDKLKKRVAALEAMLPKKGTSPKMIVSSEIPEQEALKATHQKRSAKVARGRGEPRPA